MSGASSRLGLGALLLLGVFAWAPTLYPGYWQTLQGFVPIFNVGQSAALAGIGVAPDLWRGAGSATNLLTQPWVILGFDPAVAVRLGFLLAFVIGSCGIYAWLRPFLGDLAAGLAGLLYVLQPIFLSTVYVHGSLTGALVLAWLPLALAALAASARYRPLEGAAVAVIAIMALWRTEAGLAALASVLLLVYAVFVERHWVPTLVVLTASGAALMTLLPLWSITAPPPVVFEDHFVALAQLFDVRWAVAPSTAGWQDQYPFQLGFAPIIFSLAGLWGWVFAAPARAAGATQAGTGRRRLPPGLGHLLGFAYGGVLLLALLSLHVSAPLWQWTGAQRLLTYPWEVLLLAAPLLAVTAGALPLLVGGLLADYASPLPPGDHPYARPAGSLAGRSDLPPAAAWRTPVLWVVLVALVVLGSYPYLQPVYLTFRPPAKPAAMVGTNQLAILAADVRRQVTPDGSQATLDVTWQVLQPLASDDNVFFQAVVGEGEAERVVAQVDTPPAGPDRPASGWQPGEVLTGQYTLDLSTAPADEPLRYYFGFYDWQTGVRLPVDGGIDDKLVLHAQ
jgi:hypothetical protein